MSDEFAQMWKTVFRARALLNEASLGMKQVPDDLLPMIEDLLAVVDRLRSSYDAQYAHLWQARDLLGEMTGAAPVEHPDHPDEGQEWHAVSHDLLLRAAKFLLSTAAPNG
jgi:hypothetical protein